MSLYHFKAQRKIRKYYNNKCEKQAAFRRVWAQSPGLEKGRERVILFKKKIHARNKTYFEFVTDLRFVKHLRAREK